MHLHTTTGVISLKVPPVIVEPADKEQLPTLCGIPIQGYFDFEISYKDLVSMSKNKTIDKELRSHYKQVIKNTARMMKNFNCGLERFIFLQNPTSCKIRVWFD